MDIPLFPLHTVLCPGIVVPLHIFEERYRALTRRCLETGGPFGIVLIKDGREVGERGVASLAGVGAFAEIRQAGRYPDGRYDLLAAGTGRFIIESVDASTEPYLVAEVTPLEDEVGDESRAERLAATAIRRFVQYLELLRARDGETAEELDIRVELDASDDDDDDDDDDDEDESAPIEVGIEDVDDEAIAAAIADALATDAAARLIVGDLTDDDDDEQEDTSSSGANELVIPDDPTVLSYLLSGIVQVELPRRQRLLEADTTVERLEGLIQLLDREVMLLSGRLRLFTPDLRLATGVRRS
jgi:Lon protease-like protein